MIVDLNLQIDGLNVDSIDALMEFIQNFENSCDSIYDVIYDYEVVE